MFNLAKLYSGHLKSSKRTLLIASIGLICALTIVSSTNYYFDNSKKALVDNYLSDYDKNNVYQSTEIYIQIETSPPYDSELLSNMITTIDETRQEFNIDYFKSINSTVAISGLSIPANYTDKENFNYQWASNMSAQVVELTDQLRLELHDIISNNPLMEQSILPPSKSTSPIPEVFVLRVDEMYYGGSSFSHIQNSSNIIDLFDCPNCGPNTGTSYQVNVTGLSNIELQRYKNYYDGSPPTLNQNYGKYPALESLRNNIYSEFLVFTSNITEFSSMFPVDASTITEPSFSRVSYNYILTIDFDYTKVDPYDAGGILSDINGFRQKLFDQFYNQGYQGYKHQMYFNFRSQDKFQFLESTLMSLIFTLVLVSLPVLIATIFVINYSFGLINKNVIRHIGVYKTRGATSWMLFSFQLLDNIFIMIISVIVALFTGIPISALVLQTDYLLSFNYPAPAYYILNYESIVTLLLYIAIVLTFLVNFRRVKRLSRLSIVDSENPVEKEEPYWKRHYVDFILFSFGMVMYGAFYILVKTPSLGQALGPILIILSLLILPAPFAIVIGLILIVNRFVPIALNKIGTILWDRTGDLLAFSFKNVIRHRQASTRAVMLISILIAFIVFFYALPYSMVLNNERNLYYQNGGEMVGLFDSNGLNITTMSIIQNNFSQYFDGVSPYMIASTPYFNENGLSAVMFVNTTTYVNAGYLHFDLGLTKSITTDFTNLKMTNSSDPAFVKILLNQKALEKRKSSIGQNVTILGTDSNMKAQVVDSFKHWPIIDERYRYYGTVTLGIADISYYLNTLNQSFANTPFDNINEQGVLFNFKDGVNQTLISNWIEGNTSLTIKSITEQIQKDYYTGITFRLTIGQVNNDVLMTIAISIIVLIMFAYLQLSERKKEIFTERALGMKLHQIASLFFIETIILSLTSIIIGLGVGVFLMELLGIIIFNPTQTYPALGIIFPIDIISITAMVILLSAIVVSIIPAYFVTKQDISKSFGEL